MPIVVNFWSSTCSPCRQEMPAIAKVATKFAGRVDFIGVDTFDSPTAGASFASATGVHYPLGSDPKGTLASRYGVSGLPTTFFVSPRTQIVGMNLGALTATRLVQLLAELFHIRT
jgi:thiol-disulfide isomerase/thioredoxin